MALVDYSSSDEEDGSEEPQDIASNTSNPLKRKFGQSTASDLPPLPSTFHNLYASNTRVSVRDDPVLHGGRTRVTPHVEGNWPTHLYIEWYPSPTEHAILKELISHVQTDSSPGNKIETFLTSDLGAQLPLHISLSRPIGFSTEQKDGFLEALQQGLTSCDVRPFDFSFSNLSWVANFTQTRWFLVLQVLKPQGDELNRLLATCNSTTMAYGQPPLYAVESEYRETASLVTKRQRGRPAAKRVAILERSDAFHVSIGWSLTPPRETDEMLVKDITSTAKFKEIMGWAVRVEEVKTKIGNEVTSIRLLKNTAQKKTLFGV